MSTQLDQEGYLRWERYLGFDRHGGLTNAAEMLGVSVETIRQLRSGRGNYSRTLSLAMKAIAKGLSGWSSLDALGDEPVTVYAFKTFDPVLGEVVVAPAMAPLGWIEENGFKPVPGSEMQVPPTLISDDGLYRPGKAAQRVR